MIPKMSVATVWWYHSPGVSSSDVNEATVEWN